MRNSLEKPRNYIKIIFTVTILYECCSLVDELRSFIVYISYYVIL